MIIHLGTGHIISSLSLEKVVNASKCKEVLKSPDCTSFMFGSNYQPFDGACNNIKNPLWGAAPMAFKRLLRKTLAMAVLVFLFFIHEGS